jgi:hypothetical protein
LTFKLRKGLNIRPRLTYTHTETTAALYSWYGKGCSFWMDYPKRGAVVS